jgi:hypothetical protein
MSLWRDIWQDNIRDWSFQPMAAEQVPDKLEHRTIKEGSAYLKVFLRAIRLANLRAKAARFCMAVHSNISVSDLHNNRVEFQVVTTPPELKDGHSTSLDTVVPLNFRLLGPVPYRGGEVKIEIGLFSVKPAESSGPFIDVLEKVSSTAGVSFTSTASRFVEPLKTGIRLLAGGGDSSTLEIGVSTTMPQAETGYFLLLPVRAVTATIATTRITKDCRLVDSSGKTISDYPYLVMAFEESKHRDDWFGIPEVVSHYKQLQQEVQVGDTQTVKEAFAAFEKTVLTCPDLLSDDAIRLVEKVEKEIGGVIYRAFDSAKVAMLPDLKTVNLYGQ